MPKRCLNALVNPETESNPSDVAIALIFSSPELKCAPAALSRTRVR